MSDDDRMDRAKRIREMREGDRSNDEASDDETADDSPADATTDDATNGDEHGRTDDADAIADDADTSADRASEQPTADGDSDPEPDPGSASDGDTVSGVEDAGGATEAGSPDNTEETTEVSTDVDETETHAADTATETSDETDSTADEGDDGSTLHVPGADVGDVDVDVEEMAKQAGLSSTEDESDGDRDESDGDSDDASADDPAGVEKEGTADVVQQSTAETRVLEFGLGEERYCLDIEYIEEIVKRETVTRVPNTPDYVEGVVDLRGQITTIIDPKVPLDIDDEGGKELIVVFDPAEFEEQGAIGWVVDDVNQVMPISDEEVNDPPLEEEHIIGVVDRDDEFVIWTTPDVALDEAAG